MRPRMMTMRHWITSFLNEAGDSADLVKVARVGLRAKRHGDANPALRAARILHGTLASGREVR